MVRGDLTALGANAIGALPVTRFLPSAGTIAKTGAAGALAALKKLGVTTGAQGAASAGQNLVGQVGQSVGTPSGVTVNPNEVADSAVGGAIGAGLFGSKGATRDVLNSVKYREITPELQPAATMVANRMQALADGANTQGSLFSSGNAQKVGADIMRKAADGIQSELGDAVTDLRSRVNLPVDANNVLTSAMKGQRPTRGDYATLQSAIAGDPQAPNVMNLLQQAHAADIFQNSGYLSGDKFTGGIGGFAKHFISGEHVGKTALAVTAGALAEGGAGHVIAFSPEALTAAAGVGALGRLTDNLTGAQAPAGRIIRNFADGSGQVRLNPPAQAPGAQTAAPVSPTGPKIAPLAQPWANAPAPTGPAQPPVAGGSIITPQVAAQMKARANLQKLSAANAPAPAAAGTAPVIDPNALPRNITAPAVNIMRGAALAEKLRAAQEPDVPSPAVNPLTLPKNVTGPAANIMRGMALVQKLKGSNASQNNAPQASTAPQPQQPVAGGSIIPTNVRAQMNAPQTLAKLTQPTAVSKSDGVVSEDKGAGKIPVAPYATLPVAQAAQRILSDQLAANVPIKNRNAFLTKTMAVLSTVRDKAQAVAQAAPSIPAVELARFEGVRSQRQAAAYRDHLKREYPLAAGALDRVFSDEAIAGQWAQKR
jgi:hypothetical protein